MEQSPLFFIAAMYILVIIFVALIVLINDAIVYMIESYQQSKIKETRLEQTVIYHSPNNYPKSELVNKAA